MDIRTYKDTDGKWRWTLHDARGRAIEQGEAHTRKQDAATAARARLAQVDEDRTNRASAKRRATQAKKAASRGRR